MSFTKAIKHEKERRTEYRGSKGFDRDCRNHGDCEWCRDNRTYQQRKEQARAAVRDELE